MSLENYNDLSQHGEGYQFEFCCTHCNRRWKSEYQANRLGQFTSLLGKVSEFLNGTRRASYTTGKLAGYRADGAYRSALADAQEEASHMFAQCSACQRGVCNECFNASEQICEPCLKATQQNGGGSASARGGSGPACPNCSTPSAGGRFCAECGFDMASTHKSCPGCGAMCERSTRFCADCGHGF